MLWDANTGEVRPARSKEGSDDYRYFPEPDLPPLIIPLERIDRIRDALPELPAARRARYRREHPGLSEADVNVLTATAGLSGYFEQLARQTNDPKTAANWMLGEVLAALNDTGQTIEHFTVRPADLADLMTLVRDGVVSHSAAKRVFAVMVSTGDRPQPIAEREGLLKVTDDAALQRWIDEVLIEHPAEAERFRGGERRLQGVLVGYVMKASNGSADPKRVNQLLAARVGT
jgi:aspartyl-tRNA(Asn)/glutamyl-tRNA(Gln) amidotransferase subunit B